MCYRSFPLLFGSYHTIPSVHLNQMKSNEIEVSVAGASLCCSAWKTPFPGAHKRGRRWGKRFWNIVERWERQVYDIICEGRQAHWGAGRCQNRRIPYVWKILLYTNGPRMHFLFVLTGTFSFLKFLLLNYFSCFFTRQLHEKKNRKHSQHIHNSRWRNITLCRRLHPSHIQRVLFIFHFGKKKLCLQSAVWWSCSSWWTA